MAPWWFLMILLFRIVHGDGDVKRPNVLYIVVDDLRPELPIYGKSQIFAPNLEKLGARSLIFDRAYCNQPVCSPSRNSFMSGRRPDHTKIWNFISDFREVGPNWTTLPSHFKNNGYLTLGTGKLYHEGHPVNGDGTKSWSSVAEQFSCNNSGAKGAGTYCDPNMIKCNGSGPAYAPRPRWCIVDIPMNTSTPGSFCDIDTLHDAIMKMNFAAENRKATGQPFFLGIGIRKPHLDWRVPSGFVNLYDVNVSLAKHTVAQVDRPPVSIHGPYRSSDERTLWNGWGYRNPYVPMNPDTARDMRRHYYAATSFMDSIVGRIIDELDRLRLSTSTIVTFHSDHGWSLGENGDWRKFTLTELGTRVPFLISVPWLPDTFGRHSSALVELVDVMPTLSDLSGLPNPIIHDGEAELDGTSLVDLFTPTPPSTLKPFTLSQYPRCPVSDDSTLFWEENWCIEVPNSRFGWMGYSLRTDNYRYTAWFKWNQSSLKPIFPQLPINGSDGFFNELFNYSNQNLSNFDELDVEEIGPQNPSLVADLHQKLLNVIMSE